MSSIGLEPDRLISLLHGDLTPWMKERKGELCVAADPWNFLQLLAESPDGWRGVLHFDGDANRADHHSSGCFLDNNFSFGVTCQKGLSLDPEEKLFRPSPDGTPSLLRLVSAARLRIRSYAFPADVSDRFVTYRGCEPLVLPDGTPLMGYRMRFALIAHPEPVTVYRNH